MEHGVFGCSCSCWVRNRWRELLVHSKKQADITWEMLLLHRMTHSHFISAIKGWGWNARHKQSGGTTDHVACLWSDALDYGVFIIPYLFTLMSVSQIHAPMGLALTARTSTSMRRGGQTVVRMGYRNEQMVSKHTSPNSSVSVWSQDVISKCRHSILSVRFPSIVPGLQPLNHCPHIFKPMKLLPKFELALGPTNAPMSPHIPHYFYIPSPGPPCSGVFARDLPTPVTIGLQ